MTDVFELKMCAVCIGYAFLATMVYDFGHTWLLWKKAHRFVQMLLDVITLSILGIAFTILIILAGVSINMLVGNNGIITKAQLAREDIELAQIEEQTSLNQLYEEMENLIFTLFLR